MWGGGRIAITVHRSRSPDCSVTIFRYRSRPSPGGRARATPRDGSNEEDAWLPTLTLRWEGGGVRRATRVGLLGRNGAVHVLRVRNGVRGGEPSSSRAPPTACPGAAPQALRPRPGHIRCPEAARRRDFPRHAHVGYAALVLAVVRACPAQLTHRPKATARLALPGVRRYSAVLRRGCAATAACTALPTGPGQHARQAAAQPPL